MIVAVNLETFYCILLLFNFPNCHLLCILPFKIIVSFNSLKHTLNDDFLVYLKQTIATFFSSVMAAIGGNSSGQGSHLTINMLPMHVFAMDDSVQLCSTRVCSHKFCLIIVHNPVFELVGDAVVNVYINHEKKFAFVEMRTVEEASNAMALDGIIFEACHSETFFS